MSIVDPTHAVVISTRSNREVYGLRSQGVEVDIHDTVTNEWYAVYGAFGTDLSPVSIVIYDGHTPGGRVVSCATWDKMRYDGRIVCTTCGRRIDKPRKVIRDGRIDECCVDECHDQYVEPNSNHAAFVQRAREAGITGRC